MKYSANYHTHNIETNRTSIFLKKIWTLNVKILKCVAEHSDFVVKLEAVITYGYVENETQYDFVWTNNFYQIMLLYIITLRICNRIYSMPLLFSDEKYNNKKSTYQIRKQQIL